jgi:capsid protein
VSRFAPVIAKLADLREYTDAEIVRKKMAACMVGSVTQPEGANGDTIGSVVTDSEGQRVESFSPGMMLYSSPGAETSFFSPSDSGDYSAYKKTELREIAAGLDVPYIVLNEDLSDVNYSSFRGGAIDERDGIEQYRWNWLVPQVLDSIWETFIDTLFLVGAIPEKNYGVKWNPPAFDLLDRKEEAEADMREMQIGKKTWPQMVGDQGNDPESQITQIETWKDRLNKAGVTFLTNPQGVANDAKATAAEA